VLADRNACSAGCSQPHAGRCTGRDCIPVQDHYVGLTLSDNMQTSAQTVELEPASITPPSRARINRILEHLDAEVPRALLSSPPPNARVPWRDCGPNRTRSRVRVPICQLWPASARSTSERVHFIRFVSSVGAFSVLNKRWSLGKKQWAGKTVRATGILRDRSRMCTNSPKEVRAANRLLM
jgi:hypothetical protein